MQHRAIGVIVVHDTDVRAGMVHTVDVQIEKLTAFSIKTIVEGFVERAISIVRTMADSTTN